MLNVAISEGAKLIDSHVADNAAKQSEAARRVDELEQQVVKAEKRRKFMTHTPGMAVSVEIKTGKRRILEYLFSPLAEISSEAMEER